MTREEAIKNVKTFFEGIGISLCNLTKESFNTLIPELAESEDERIRIGLIDIFNSALGQDFLQRKAGLDRNKVIAYLEKQKEQKSRIDACGFPLRDEGESACSYLERCLSPDMRNIWYEACSEIKEKQKEQKPSIFPSGFGEVRWNPISSVQQKPVEWSEDIIRKTVKEVGLTQHQIDWFKTNVFPPKQEWSEEDIYITNVLEYIVGKHRPDEIFKIGNKQGVSAYKICSWLNSLRSQSKAELTLLNENMIEAAVAFVEQNDHFSYWRGIDKNTVIKALRSLKPYWKPSEEQMEALKEASASWMNARMGNAKLLKSLYEQLKKLM